MAWNALQAYLSASATRTSTIRTGWSRKPNRLGDRVARRRIRGPERPRRGVKKSATPEPSRRNSGHIAGADAEAGAGQAAASAGYHVLDRPGGTVLRMTTLCRPAAAAGRRSAAAMSSTARRMKARSVPPRAVDGVPTQTSDTSAPSSASGHDVVACRVPPGHRLRDEGVKARLGHRAAAGADLTDLGRVDIHTPDVVAVGGQAGGSHRADVAKADNGDLHASPHLLCWCGDLNVVDKSTNRVAVIRQKPFWPAPGGPPRLLLTIGNQSSTLCYRKGGTRGVNVPLRQSGAARAVSGMGRCSSCERCGVAVSPEMPP